MFKYELMQEGRTVAFVSSSSQEDALREIQHYAFMYGQDGPVEIREAKECRWTTIRQ